MKIQYLKKVEKTPYMIYEVDGCGLQAHIAASLSHDPNLVDLFMRDGDFHSHNAYHIMAQYQLFDETTVLYTDESSAVFMEWKTQDIKRGETLLEHQVPSSLLPGDILDGKTIKNTVTAKRPLTGFDEFDKNCKKGRLKEIRTTAKLIGFGMIFGMSASAFAGGTLRMEWDAPMCKKLIEDLNLQDLYIKIASESNRGTEEDLLYLTVATFFRSEFFKLYPVLERWILQCGADAVIAGYARSPFGARRLLPQLQYQGKHSDKAEIKNLSNIAVNSPVQDWETVYMSRVMIESNKEFEALDLDALVVGTVHDSIVLFANRDCKDVAMKIVLKWFQEPIPEENGIPYSGEANEADPLKGECWGLGKKEYLFQDLKDVVIPTGKYSFRMPEEAVPISAGVRSR